MAGKLTDAGQVAAAAAADVLMGLAVCGPILALLACLLDWWGTRR